MESSALGNAADDLQAVFSSHAEYHLSRAQNDDVVSSFTDESNSNQDTINEITRTLKQEVPTSVIDCQKSVLPTPQNVHNVPETCLSRKDERNNIAATEDNLRKSNEVDYFGSESSVFSLTEDTVSINSDGHRIHLEESEDFANDLAEVGLNEDNLQELALSTSKPNESQNDQLTVHPVGLKKCFTDKNIPTSDVDPGKVTTLLDLSSIGKLKHLWAKGDAASKKSKTVAKPLSQPKPVKELSNESKRVESKTKSVINPDITESVLPQKSSDGKSIQSNADRKTTKLKSKITTKPLKIGNVKNILAKPVKVEGKTSSSKASKQAITILNFKIKYCTKPCSVKIRKLESMNLERENLKIDMTLPNILAQMETLKGRPSNLSKKVIAKVTENHGVKSSKALESVIRFVTKSITKVASNTAVPAPSAGQTKSISKLYAQTSSEKVSKKRGRPKSSGNLPGPKSSNKSLFVKQESEKSDVTDDHVNNEVVPASYTVDYEDDVLSDFDIDRDSDGDYSPSEDEFKPSKKDSLKNAFTKSKPKLKKKFKKSMSDMEKKQKKDSESDSMNQKEIKTENNAEDSFEDIFDAKQKKRKYVRSSMPSTCRIGRPPVLGHFECKLCDFTAKEKNLVDKHHAKSHKQKVLQCGYCDAKFRSRNGLWEHEAYKHTNEKPFKCKHEGCDYASKNPVDLGRHQSKHATEKCHSCEICGWSTKWRRNMKHHQVMKHSDERKYKCDLCPFTAKRTTDLKQHMYRHNGDKPITCLKCGFCVKTNWELRSHMLSHSTVKPFKCTFPGCDAATKTNADLTKHRRIHTSERNFKCELCSRTYKDRQSLNKHHSYMHTVSRPFTCDTCGNSFKCKAALRKHMSLHTGIKPHVCSTCGKAFANKNNMQMHMKTHDAKERPYKCPLCPYLAREPGHLLPHIGTFHRDTYAYFCEICKKPFNRYLQLQTHIKRMHTEKEIKHLGTSNQVDLALLKMEMNLDLEKAERDRKRGKKSRSKSVPKGNGGAMEIKQEPIDEEYLDGEILKRENVEEITDVRLNAETGQIEVVKGKGSRNAEQVVSTMNHDTNEDVVGSETNAEMNDTFTESSVTDADTDKFYDTDIEQMESEQMELNGEIKNLIEKEEELDKDMIGNEENIVLEIDDDEIDSDDLKQENTTATLAMFDGFRLPLATKGFRFNYDKNGKKPKAWYMDTSVMCARDAAKQNAYLRRKGINKPLPKGLPKGHKKKKSLDQFLKERNKKRNENINKSNFIKGIGLMSKNNGKRKARFTGSYSQFENLEGDELSVYQVREILPKMKSPKNVMKSPSKKSEPPKSKAPLSNKAKEISSVKQKKKVLKKKRAKKLLLSTEKQMKSKSKDIKLTIRKPKYIKGAEKSTEKKTPTSESAERNSFAALESIINEVAEPQETVEPIEKVTKTKSVKKQSSVKKNVEQKVLMGERGKTVKDATKLKYNKKYVPVKPIKKTKEDKGAKLAKPVKKTKDKDTSLGKKKRKTKAEDKTEVVKKKKKEAEIMKSVEKKLKAKGSAKTKTKTKVVSKKKRLQVKIPSKPTKENKPAKNSDKVIPDAEGNIGINTDMELLHNVHFPIENSQFVVVFPPYAENSSDEIQGQISEKSTANEINQNNLVERENFYDATAMYNTADAQNVSAMKLEIQGLNSSFVHPVMLTHTPVKNKRNSELLDVDDEFEHEMDGENEIDSKSSNTIPRVAVNELNTGMFSNTAPLNTSDVSMDSSGDSNKDIVQEDYTVVKREPSVDMDYFTSLSVNTA